MRSTGGDRRGVQKGRASGQECGESQAQGASWTEMGGGGYGSHWDGAGLEGVLGTGQGVCLQGRTQWEKLLGNTQPALFRH